MKNVSYSEALFLLGNTRSNLFITGGAGTGKSTLLREFAESNRAVILAPTGVAALNAGGMTIHSFFKFKLGVTPQTIEVNDKLDNILKRVKTIVIDEVSMVRADIMDCIDQALKIAKDSILPFGGIRMIFIGDLYQLSPVVQNFGCEKDMFNGTMLYDSPYFFSAKVFAKYDYIILNLTEVFRQTELMFVDILNKIRVGDVNYKILHEINSRCFGNPQKDGIFLTSTNQVVSDINSNESNKLTGKEFSFTGILTDDFNINNLPNDIDLSVKIGSRVMLLNNDRNSRWVNGSLGIVINIKTTLVEEWVEEDDTKYQIMVDKPCLIVKLNNGNIVEIPPYTWESIKMYLCSKTDEVKSSVIGTFTQYPVKEAWAFTIHKSQGKTFDKISLMLDIRKPMYTPGQLYVALSRATKIDGIRINRKLRMSDVVVDKRINEYFKES